MTKQTFDAKNYWEKRLQGDYDLHGVGLIEWGEAFNRVLYRLRRVLFLRLLRAQRASWAQAEVLDIGSGTGFYLERWQELGAADIHGMDLTEVAVANLQQKFPDMDIHCGDIGQAPLAGMHEKLDAVSCMDVVFHIVDDDAYQRAFKHIAEMLKPGGLFVFSDSWLKGETVRGVHIVHRSRSEVQATLASAGFELLEVVPMFVLMNAPVDSQSRLLKAWWWSLYQISARSHVLGGLIAQVLSPIERLLLMLARHDGPTTKVMVCRKR